MDDESPRRLALPNIKSREGLAASINYTFGPILNVPNLSHTVDVGEHTLVVYPTDKSMSRDPALQARNKLAIKNAKGTTIASIPMKMIGGGELCYC